jgi:hypothetical protein
MLDLDRQLREFGSFVDEAVEPVPAAEITGPPALRVPHPWRRHLALAGVAAVIVVLIIAVVVILDPFGSEGPFIEEPTTIPPATTTLITSTTQASETTVAPPTTQAPILEPPSITWTRVDDPAAFGRYEYQGMAAIESGPVGLIAVGVDWYYPSGPDLIGIDGAVWTSADGATWSRIGEEEAFFGGNGTQVLTSIAVGAETVVVGGLECPVSLDSPGCRAAVWVSEDVLDWEKIEVDGDLPDGSGQQQIQDVIATEDGFLAVGSAVWVSTDGRSWERVFDLESTFGTNTPGGIMHVVIQTPSGYVAAGVRGFQAAVWISADGRHWSAVEDEGQFGPPSVASEQTATDFTYHRIADLLNSSGTILGVGHGAGTQVDSSMVWRSVDGASWEQIAIDRFSNHRSETMHAIIQIGEWVLAAGFHNDFSPHNQARAYYAHGAILIWGSNDHGATWSVLPTEVDVLGNYLSDDYPTWVGDMIVWNDRIVMVGSRGNKAGSGFQTAWDAAVWIGTIED